MIYNVLDPSQAWGLGRILSGLQKAGLYDLVVEDGEFQDTPTGLNRLVGKTLYMALSSEAQPMYATLSEAERAAGVKAKPLTGPDGRELTNGYRVVTDWTKVIGPAEDSGTY